MGVSVGSVGVGERSVVISIAIAMVSIQTAVVQPWVSLRISISLGSGFGIGFGIGISLFPFGLNSRSLCNWSRSSSHRYVSEVRSLSTGDKFALAVLAPSGRGSVYYGSMGGSIH